MYKFIFLCHVLCYQMRPLTHLIIWSSCFEITDNTAMYMYFVLHKKIGQSPNQLEAK